MKIMNSDEWLRPVLGLGLLLFLTFLAPVASQAQTGGPYDLSWHVIAGGGATFATGGSYQLGGTAGQHDVGLSTGGTYTLNIGFWLGGQANSGVGPLAPPVLSDTTALARALKFRVYSAGSNPGQIPLTVGFDLPTAQSIRLTVFDSQGQRLRVLAAGAFAAGRHKVQWDGAADGSGRVGNGVYFVRFEAGPRSAQAKLVLMK